MVRVGVVVPFYQREPGLLRKALTSVLAQELPDDVKLVVVPVNDASPCPPDADLADLGPLGRHELVSLSRPNGGPGAARNTGLDYLSGHPVDFVAFIDSDDVWRPRHLATALDSMGAEDDFFFADHDRDYFAHGESYFTGNPTIQRWFRSISNSPIEPTDKADVFRLRKEYGLLPFMQDYLSQTSTVVYRHDRLGHIRFDPTLRIAGEDLLFWMSLAREARRICFSTRNDVQCESGVNIFHSTLTWDSPNAPARFAYQLMLWRYIRDRFDLSAEEAAVTRDKIAGFGRGFSYLWFRSFIKTGRVNQSTLQLLRDRLGWRGWRVIPNVADVMRRKVLRQPLFPEH